MIQLVKVKKPNSHDTLVYKEIFMYERKSQPSRVFFHERNT